MHSHDEMLRVLRSVRIFSTTPDSILNDVVQLLEVVAAPAGTTIFEKGAPGNCMYMIAAGHVRVHDGERVLNDLWACDVFGEMALLDHEERSASVIAIEDTRLLRLEQTALYNLITTHGEVAHGIIRVLSQHLRARLRDMARDFTYLQRMERLTAAAAALETGVYQSSSLDAITQAHDELGRLARVFQHMADQIIAREDRLQQQVQALQIEINEVRRTKEVASITETDYFRSLQRTAQQLRDQRNAATTDDHKR